MLESPDMDHAMRGVRRRGVRAEQGMFAVCSALALLIAACGADPAPVARCGDGALDPGEACDDGNRDATDDCLPTCRVPAPRTRTVGPFLLQPGMHRPVLTLYLVSPGGPLQGELSADPIGAPGGAGEGAAGDPYPASEHLALVRVLDPDERVVHWHLQRQRPGDALPDTLRSSSEPPPAFTHDASGVLRGYRFSLEAPGVHQVRITTNSLKTAVRLTLPEGVGVGVAYGDGAFAWPFCRGTCGATPATSLWAYAPRHPTAPLWLAIRSEREGVPAVHSADGVLRVPVAVDGARRYVVRPGRDNEGELWRVDLPSVDAGRFEEFRASGFPLVLADTAESARAIHASVERVPSGPHAGTLVHHRFQREILALLPRLLDHARLGDAAALDALDDEAHRAVPRDPACSEPASASDVWRRGELLDGWDSPLRAVRFYLAHASADGDGVVFGAGRRVLEDDAASHWAGAVGLAYLARQRCAHDSDCVAGGACDVANGVCDTPFDAASPAARWDVLRGLRYTLRAGLRDPGAFTGLAVPGAFADHLGLAATAANPCNPWGPAAPGAPLRHPELVALAAAAGLADLLVLGEDERFLPVGDDDPYPGSLAFQLPQATSGFARVAPHLAEALGDPALAADVQRVWGEGLRRAVDRLLPAYLVTTMNQSSHLLVATEELAHGYAGRPEAALYRAAARAFAARFADAADPAGWLEEASGPSHSYAGMQHWHMGRYLALTAADPEGEDARLRDALAASYAFFGATAVREPDGQRTTGFDFAHRIGTGFELEQYRGARGLAETIPSVAVWSDWLYPSEGPGLEAGRAALRGHAGAFGGALDTVPQYSLHGHASRLDTLDVARRPAGLRLPADEVGSFVRVFGAPSSPRLVTVRRERASGDAWYAAAYVAPTAPESIVRAHWGVTRAVPLRVGGVVREDWPASLDAPVGATTEHAIDLYAITPMLSGGLSLFGTTTFGSAVVGTNWSPLTHHGLVAEHDAPDGRVRSTERYASVTIDPAASGEEFACARAFADLAPTSLDASPPALTTFAALEEDRGLCVARRLLFGDDGVEVEVRLRRIAPPGATPLARLDENVPLPTCTRPPCGGPADPARGVLRNRKADGATLTQTATGFALRDASGRGLDVVLETPVPATAHPEGLRSSYYGDELQIGRVMLEVPIPAAVGDEATLRYRLLPVVP
jgi:cysteine-rich repeat protein